MNLFIQILMMLGINAINQSAQVDPKPTLEFKIRQAKTNITRPPLLLLLHGVGSNEDHLFQLANYLDGDYMIISARAPFTRSTGSYKWYDVDFSTGKPVINANQAEESRKIILQFIEELKTTYSFDESKVFVGGFSQGAIMSYSVGLTSPEKVTGIVALSGRMLQEVKPLIAKQGLEDLQALVVHGTNDNVLPIAYAHQARTFLTSKQIPTHYEELDMGHTINETVVEVLNQWLSKQK